MKRKLLLWSFLLILISTIVMSGIISVIGKSKIENSLELQQNEVLLQLRNNFKIFDELLNNIENKMIVDMTSSLKEICNEIILKESWQTLPDLELRKIADKYNVNEIYLIDKEGTVFNTTFAPDINFNLKTINDEFASFIQSIYGKGEVFNSRISISEQTGILNMYSYYSPTGSDYIIESSLRIKDFIISNYSETYYDLIFRDIFVHSVKDNDNITSFDIYRLTNVSSWSFLNQGKQLRTDKDIGRQATPDKEVIIKKGDEVTIWFMPDFNSSGYDFANDFYIEVIYDISAMNKMLSNIILLSGVLYFIVILITYLVASWIFSYTYIRRLDKINTGLGKIAIGDYSTELKGDEEDGISEISTNILSMQTKIKEREEVIREREDFNKALFDYSPVETIIVDLEGKITDFNFAVRQSRKRLPEIGMMMYKDYASKHRTDMHAEMMNCLRTKESKIFLDSIYDNSRSFRVTIAPFSGGCIITSEEITEQKNSRDRIENLNSILLAIRNVNQLITQVKDKYVLIETAVKLLTETGIYSKAWVGFFNDEKKIDYVAATSNDNETESYKEFLLSGSTTGCLRMALSGSYTQIISNPTMTCRDCPYSKHEEGRGVYITKLAFNDRLYGVFSVSIPFQLVNDPESVGLFEEIAEDLAYAMYNLETEAKQLLAEQSLKESEKLNRTVIEGSPIGISVRDKNGTLLLANDAWRKIWDLKEEDVEKYSEKRDNLKFDEKDDYLSEHSGKIKDVYIYGGEYYIPELKLKELRERKAEWVSQLFYAIKDDEGKVSTVVILTEDITGRKKNEDSIKRTLKEKELLLNEVHHRVKNNMQIVSSMLKMQSRKIKDPVASGMFAESMNRIKSMALIHERLYLSDNFSRIDFHKYLGDLSRFLKTSVAGSSNISFNLDITEERPNINRAIPCGLIVNELVTNALKFAFPNKEKGNINISLQYETGVFTLIVENDGVPFPQDVNIKKSKTLGMSLIRALAAQMHGTLDLDRTTGAKFTIQFMQEVD